MLISVKPLLKARSILALRRQLVVLEFFRCRHETCKESHGIQVSPLSQRSIIQVSGKDSLPFLQGLVTNDVANLQQTNSMYAMILNQRGRVEHDIFMYRPSQVDEETILLDCHSESVEEIQKTFKLYRLRKKVNLTAREDYKVWQVQLHKLLGYPRDVYDKKYLNDQLAPKLFEHGTAPLEKDKIITLNIDPRLSWLGWRVIATEQPCPDALIAPEDDYHKSRYFYGIPEGPLDLPPGKCLPLESNLDFMNGISFTKGCYLGQELTARSNYVGTIRKRLMPVSINSRKKITEGEKLYDQKGKSVGKFRSCLTNYGLALINLSHQNCTLLTLNRVYVDINPTYWWPVLLPH